MFFKYVIDGKESDESYESPLDAWKAAHSDYVVIEAYREELDFYLPCLENLKLTSRQKKNIERSAWKVVKFLLDAYNADYYEERIGYAAYKDGKRRQWGTNDPSLSLFPENMGDFDEFCEKADKLVEQILHDKD